MEVGPVGRGSKTSQQGLASAPKPGLGGLVQKCLGQIQWQGVSQAYLGSPL